jgi:dihydrofolate reductase
MAEKPARSMRAGNEDRFCNMKISIIAALGENRVIGAQGKIPWHLPADFQKFKALTLGHPVIMGKNTFESIGKPLPGRTNIVLTKDPNYAAEGCVVAHSLDDALALAGKESEEIFIIGGGAVYELALPLADTLYLTEVHGIFEGDAFFPEFNEDEWRLVSSEPHTKDEKNAYDYEFRVYEREKVGENGER